jgi:hypothetical protein
VTALGRVPALCFGLHCAWAATGCSPAAGPDPRSAVAAYADAASRGDAAALYGLLASDAQRSVSPDEVRAMVADERAELAEQARRLRSAEPRVEASARLRFSDGEEAVLDLRDGRFGVTSAGTLPGGGRSPEETLDQLRRALARRSYDSLLRVLTAATRSSVEGDVRNLVEGLKDSSQLVVHVTGDLARVPIAGGHMVTLKREAGIWRVQNFD